jgi:catechol 2,3-dioxygenase-like lactoylglutathione lyase family enzyme
MTRIAIWALAVFLTTSGGAFAQRQPFNEAGVTMGHWHLNSQNIEANKKILVALGGTAIKPGDFEIVNFPGVNVFLHLRAGSPPSTGGTAGTVINHVGFLVPNVQEAFAKWQAAGVPIEMGKNDNGPRIDQAWVTTADGLRIEILEDKAQTVPIRHHHVHWYVPEAAQPQVQGWYVQHFGAQAGKRGNFPTANIPGAELAFAKTDTPTVPTKGRVLDHIGFDVKDMDATVKRLTDAGITLDQPVLRRPDGSALTFTHDPWGASIELNQRANPL